MAWAPDYCTAADLKEFVHIGDTVDDSEVALAVTAASRAIDNHTSRQFGVTAAAEERFYTARFDRGRLRWMIEIDDLMTATGLEVTVDGAEITDFTLAPRNHAAKGKPWTHLIVGAASTVVPNCDEDGVSVTATFGWTAIPAAVTEACLLQGSRFLKRREAPFGVAGSPERGSELRLLAKVDPDVAVALSGYVRWWGAR
jgi:hypothetical protein